MKWRNLRSGAKAIRGRIPRYREGWVLWLSPPHLHRRAPTHHHHPRPRILLHVTLSALRKIRGRGNNRARRAREGPNIWQKGAEKRRVEFGLRRPPGRHVV